MSVFKRWNGTSWEVIGPQITSTRFDDTNHMIAPEYSPTETYNVGDYVVQSDHLYRCTTAIQSGEVWTSSHWTEVKVGNEVNELKSAFIHFENNYVVTQEDDYLYSYRDPDIALTKTRNIQWKNLRISIKEAFGNSDTIDGSGRAIHYSTHIPSYIYVDANGNVLYASYTDASLSQISKLAAPSGAAEIIINSMNPISVNVKSFVTLLEDGISLRVNEANPKLNTKTSDYIDSLIDDVYHPVFSANLIHGNYSDNEILDATGATTSDSSYTTTDYIEVIPSKLINFTRAATTSTRMKDSALWAFYDDSKTFIVFVNNTSLAQKVPTNAKYVRCSFAKAYKGHSPMIEYTDGTTFRSTYEAYFEPYFKFFPNPSLYGKKICCFGDSLAASDNGLRSTYTWIEMVKDYFNCAEAYNRGIGASTVTSVDRNGNPRTGYAYVDANGDAGELRGVYQTQQTFENYPNEISPFMNGTDRANTIPTDTDIVIILAGANDAATTTVEDFKTAYAQMLSNIQTRVPNAKIYPCTLCFHPGYDIGTSTRYKDLRNTIKEVAYDFGFPVIDFKADMGINEENYADYMNDTTHYNTPQGRRKTAECVCAKLMEYCKIRS